MAQRIPNQEIFATGKWNGDAYTEADLDSIVSAFHSLKWSVPIKLGHDEAQRWFGQADGAPALGWVSNLRRTGGKLIADFENVPNALAAMIQNKNYRNKSAEIYWNLESDGQKWPRALKAVSLLGADLPAVTTLNELQSVLMSNTGGLSYTISSWADTDGTSANEPKWETYIWEPLQEDNMNAEQEKVYKDRISALEGKLATFEAKTKEETKRADEAEAKAVKAEAELKSRDEKFAVEQFVAKVDGFIKEGKVAPYEKEILERQFVALGAGVRKYGDKDYNPREELLKSLESRTVKFHMGKENAVGGEGNSEEIPAAIQIDKLAKKFASEHKFTYEDGLRKVKSDEPELWGKYMTESTGGRK